MFIALTMCPASVYQMMRGSIVVITALMSMAFLGRKQYRHHWTGIVLIVLGVVLVGLVSTFSPKAGDEPPTVGSEWLGILLLIIS
jgi:drug/metabolite transporter (DMT)-like permease